MPCKYYDSGWCYAPPHVEATEIQGMCNNMEDCPQAVSWDKLIEDGKPRLLTYKDSGDDSEEHW